MTNLKTRRNVVKQSGQTRRGFRQLQNIIIMAKYIRTEIVGISELNEAAADYARRQYDWDENLEDARFVANPIYEDEPLHLGEFEKTSGGLFDGVQGLHYGAAFFIKISKCGDAATVAYRTF